MKALTITQPWATLVAIGAKKIETRSWNTNYRGQLAIHAAKGMPAKFRSLCNWSTEPFASALKNILWDDQSTLMRIFGQDVQGTSYRMYPERLHLGCVIATCRLVNCLPIVQGVGWPGEPELSFGDYTPGRYAWILENVKTLPEPIPAKGALGLWDWEPPK